MIIKRLSKSEHMLNLRITDVRKLYPPPYRCFYEAKPSVSQLLRAHEYLTEVVEEDGPFESISGFSQSAEVAASLLLYQAWEVHFNFAVFIGGTKSFDVSALASGKISKPVKMCAGTHSTRINVPTAHVIGRSDACRKSSKAFLELCNRREVKVCDHKGAHVVPRGQEAVEDLTAALNWVVDQAMYQVNKRIARVEGRERLSLKEATTSRFDPCQELPVL